MSQLPIPGGHTYSDDYTTDRDMNDGGHRIWMMPMIAEFLAHLVSVLATTANDVTAAAGSASAAANSASAASNSASAASTDAHAAHQDRLAADADAQATAADRQAVAQDRTAVEGSASAAAGSATLAGQYAAAAGGAVPSVRLTWDTATADADPGNGKVRLNNATPTAATALYVDNVDAAGASITAVLDRWTASTNPTKGTLRIAHRTDAAKWLEYQVTGTVVDGTGYRKITVTGGTGPGGFAAGDPVAVGFSRAGDMPNSFAAGTAAAPGWAVTGDGDTGLAQLHGANSMSLVGGGIERLCILPNGNIGIGTGAPGAELEIADSAGDGDVRINLRASASIIGQIGRSLAAMFIDTVTGQPFQFFIGGFEQLRVKFVNGATRYVSVEGSAAGNPKISTNAGGLDITAADGSAVVLGTGQTAQFPEQAIVQESAHATSRHARLKIGSMWAFMQDYDGIGTKNFGLYSWAINSYLFQITVGGVWKFMRGALGAPVNLGNISGTVTLDLLQGNTFYATLIGAVTFAAPSNLATFDGMYFTLILKQDGTGGRTAGWNSVFNFGGNSLTLSTTANKTDRITCQVVGSGIHVLAVKGY